MKSAIRTLLQKGFDGLFTSYRPEWVELGVEMAGEAEALFVSDVEMKYPKFSETEDREAALAKILDTDATIVAILLYRAAHALYQRDSKHEALSYFAHFMRVRTAMEIYYSAQIGPRFRVIHGLGLVLGARHRIGSDFTVYQGVTLGQRRNNHPEEFLTIGDRCTFFAGSVALGLLRVGNDVKLGANSVLLADADEGGTYVGAPARKSSR